MRYGAYDLVAFDSRSRSYPCIVTSTRNQVSYSEEKLDSVPGSPMTQSSLSSGLRIILSRISIVLLPNLCWQGVFVSDELEQRENIWILQSGTKKLIVIFQIHLIFFAFTLRVKKIICLAHCVKKLDFAFLLF